MFGRDKLVLHLVCLGLGRSKNLRHPRAEILLSALHAWKTSDRRLCVVENDSDVRTKLAEYWSNNPFRLFEHRDEQMLRLNLLMLIPLRELNGGLNSFLTS